MAMLRMYGLMSGSSEDRSVRGYTARLKGQSLGRPAARWQCRKDWALFPTRVIYGGICEVKRVVDHRVQEYLLDVRKKSRPLHCLVRRGRERPQRRKGQHQQQDSGNGIEESE